MKRIGVVGDSDSIIGFKSLGIDVFPATGDDTGKTIFKLAEEGYAIIFVTEEAAGKASETIERYKTQPYPAIIPIPGNKGSLGLGMKGIRENVEKAIGTDIFFDNE